MKILAIEKQELLALLLVLPMIIRVFLSSSIEQLFIVDKGGISFFIFNLFYIIYFILSPKTNNRRNIIIIRLIFLQWFLAFISSIVLFEYPNLLNFFFTCQGIFIIPIVFLWAPLSKKQIDFLKWPLIVTFSYLSLEIVLFATGVLSMGWEEHYYGGAIRIGNTTIGGTPGAGVFLFILGSIIFDNYITAKKQTLFLFFWSIPIFLTISRGGIFAFVIIVSYVIIRKTGNIGFIKKIGYIFFLFLLSFLLFKINLFNPIIERSQQINYYSNDITSGRTDRYEFAYNKYQDSPIFGIGIANIYTPSEANLDVGWSPHNLWLTVLAEQGIIGLVLQIFIFFNILFSIEIRSYSFVSMIIILFILMNVESIFIHDEYYALLFLFIVIAQKKTLKAKENRY